MQRAGLVTSALSIAACAATPAHVAGVEPDDRAAITLVLDHQAEAWNRGDLAGFMEGYAHTPTLVFTSGSHVRRGWQDAFDHYKAVYATDPKAMGHLAFKIESIDPIGADGAVMLGDWDLTRCDHPGHGVFTLVFERRPEGWRVIHDHTSDTPEAHEAPKAP